MTEWNNLPASCASTATPQVASSTGREDATGPVPGVGSLRRFVNTSGLARSRHPPTFGAAIGLVIMAFLLAGLLQVYGAPARAVYTSAVAAVSEGVARWLEPVSLGIHLKTTGSIVQVGSDLFRVGDVTAFDTAVYFFYLPFIAILLLLAAWRYRLVSLPEVAIVLGTLVAVHVTCTSLRVLWAEAERLRSPVASLIGEWEFAILQRLARFYYIYGAQLWSGLAVALVMLRSGGIFRRSSVAPRPSMVSTGAIGAGCFIVILPALSFISLAPPLRYVTGGVDQARSAVALALAAEGRHREAAEMYTAVSHPAAVADIPVLLALASLAKKGGGVEAETWYQRVLSLDSRHPAANRSMGSMMGRRGRFDEAAEHFKIVLSLDPDDPDVLYQLGNCQAGLGDRYAARDSYEQVVAVRPDSPRALAKLGWIHAAEGEPCRAMALYARCLALEPDTEVAEDARRRLQELESRCPEGQRREG